MDLIYSYADMPKDSAIVEGMKIVSGDTEQYRVKVLDVMNTREGNELPIRLLIPERLDEAGSFPIYMHIQGSAWMKQNMFDHLEDLKGIAKAGYIVAILSYRPTPDYIFPTQVKDIKSQIRFLHENKDEYHIDFSKAFLGGDSSGGHTALMVYVSYNKDLFDDEKTNLPEIKGFIDCYGPVNISTMVDEISGVVRAKGTIYPESLLIGKEVRDDYEIAQKTNPINYLDNQKSPLLILHGNKDRLVPFQQSVELFEACKKRNINAEFVCVDNADHGGSAFWCDAVIEKILDFMNNI